MIRPMPLNVLARLMGLKTVSPERVRQLIEGGQATVIDVNDPQRWATAHVPGARNLPPTGFSESDLPPDKNALLVFYCSNPLCRKAPNAARRAKQMGYGNVHVMSAGITGWLDARMPTEQGAATA
jgi:rhodanese-related sulfurtransferase